jgi:hypothetical protein
VSAAAPNIQVCASKLLIGIQPISAQIGGSARAYLADSSGRQRSAIMGIHGTIASVSWIFMQTVVSPERAHVPRSARKTADA